MPSADPMGPAQPVAAKSSTLSAPATPDRNKRRTWFGLVTPTRRDQRRTATLSRQPQPATTSTPSTPSNSNGVEELDATPDAKAVNRTPVQNQRQWNAEDQLGSERDWDSDQEGTVRYKGSRIKANSEDEPIRMKDMATLATLTRNNTVKPVRILGPQDGCPAVNGVRVWVPWERPVAQTRRIHTLLTRTETLVLTAHLLKRRDGPGHSSCRLPLAEQRTNAYQRHLSVKSPTAVLVCYVVEYPGRDKP